MSAALIEGNVSLSHGQRQTSGAPYYTLYSTALKCSRGAVLPANIRLYSPPNEPLLADQSIVHLVGCFIAPTSSTILIDALYLTTYPGDPTDDEYDTHLPL